MADDPGKRDRLVTIQEMTSSIDADSGEPVEAWDTLATVFMEKVEMRGNERFQSQQMTAPYDTRWRLPYRTDMDPETLDVPKDRRLVYKNRVYDIISAQMIGRRDGIELMTLSGGTYQ